MKKSVTALGALAVLATAGTAQAGTIIQPKNVTVIVGGELAGSPAVNMINQSGLSKKYVSGKTDFHTYLASNPIHSIAAGGEWLSTEPRTTAKITFDFGEVIEFSGFAYWNEDASSLQSMIMSIPFGGGYGSTSSYVQNIEGQAYGASVRNHQLIKSRYVSFDLYGCDMAGFSHNGCGMGEVAFHSTQMAAVPEPATWAMMIVGFGAVGSVVRRRRPAFATFSAQAN
jgi:hypothetical protein